MESKQRRWRPWAGRIGEVAGLLVLVLCFFMVFMGMLGLAFPQGTGLGDLLQYGNADAYSRNVGLEMDLGPEGSDPFVAQLTAVSRRVLGKRSQAISWSAAQSGMQLENRHAVQTFERSWARISFSGSDALRLGENSLVIVRSAEQSRRAQRKRASLVMLGGELEAIITPGGPDAIDLEIVTAGATARIDSSGDDPTTFRVGSGDDQSSSFSVLSGTAEVTAAGKNYTLNADEALTVDPTGTSVRRIALPATPVVAGPHDGTVYTYSSAPPTVDFAWDPVQDAAGYRIEIAVDADFDTVLFDVVVDDARFVHEYLEEGSYYWRVAGMQAAMRGQASAPRSFDIRYDDVGPGLDVAFPSQPQPRATWSLSGQTEPGASVFVAGQSIAVDVDGRFETPIELRLGANLILIEAFDSAGNVTYLSEYVHARF